MNIKKFSNIWAIGLILFGILLIAFYVAKIFFPEFIVGVAEIPTIVKFGNYVDTHKWASIIFHIIISYVSSYIYYSACYRKRFLNLKENICMVLFIFGTIFIQHFLPKIYTPFLYVTLILQPFIMLVINKRLTEETFISVAICFIIDILAQAMSMQIRDVVLLAQQLNTATVTILLIDTWIWRILLYLFFNYQNKKEI